MVREGVEPRLRLRLGFSNHSPNRCLAATARIRGGAPPSCGSSESDGRPSGSMARQLHGVCSAHLVKVKGRLRVEVGIDADAKRCRPRLGLHGVCSLQRPPERAVGTDGRHAA